MCRLYDKLKGSKRGQQGIAIQKASCAANHANQSSCALAAHIAGLPCHQAKAQSHTAGRGANAENQTPPNLSQELQDWKKYGHSSK
jgi:hypothetical protein